ncbi:MAG: hypothetical protein IKS85_01130 [Lachnospiraceae bacterium]|nr:hypothetical protein [Lachnospiraceae bacterium]
MKKRSFTIWLSVFWVVIALLALGGATYAWFTFNPSTNVEPMTSTISDGDVALLISTDAGQEFKTNCILPQSVSGDLDPVSTVDLEHFYNANLQDRQGISVGFQACDQGLDAITIHGTLYLKSLKDNCAVYFNRGGMDFGSDPQMLAALRLGMRFTTSRGVQEYIFQLNDLGNVSGAASTQTTAQTGVVVGSVMNDGTPNYVPDPSRGLADYFAVMGAGSLPRPGRQSLCTINANEIVTVEYWLYLEGCDENCINEVQEKEAIIQLSFAGVTQQ